MATRSWIVTGPRTDDVAAVQRLRVQLVAGRVEIQGHDEEHVHIAVDEISGNPVEISQDGGALTIGYPFLGWDGWWKRLRSYRSRDTARVRIFVPREVALSVGTALADMVVTGLHEDLNLATASARIQVYDSHGALHAKSASGPVEVLRHDGPVRVSSAAGRVDVQGDLPRAEITTVAGAISVTTATPTCVMDLSTVSGSMDLQLPAGTGLSLTARTVSGGVRVDGVDRRTAAPGTSTMQDRPGAEVCWLTTKSVSGALSITRGANAVNRGRREEQP